MPGVSVAEIIGLAALITVTTACIDFAAARYNRALVARKPHRASRWSVAHWAMSMIGFTVAIKVSMWFLLAEPLGLYLGTMFGVGRDADELEDGHNGMRETYDHVTTVKCGTCAKDVSGVRLASSGELVVSRHLRGDGFCGGSLGKPQDKPK